MVSSVRTLYLVLTENWMFVRRTRGPRPCGMEGCVSTRKALMQTETHAVTHTHTPVFKVLEAGVWSMIVNVFYGCLPVKCVCVCVPL